MNDYFKPKIRNIKRSLRCHYLFITVAAVFLIALLLDMFVDLEFHWIIVFPIAIIAASVSKIVSTAIFIKQFSRVQFGKINNIKIASSSISHLCYVEYITRYLTHTHFYGIKITDKQNKKKYYYFYEKSYEYSQEDMRYIKSKFEREINIQCYEGTNIIKTIENDPHFLTVKYNSGFKSK